MTTPTAPSRATKIAAVLYLLLGAGIYAHSWWDLLHPNAPVNPWAFLLGSLGILALTAVVRTPLGMVLAGLVLVVVVRALGTESFHEDFGTGLSTLVVVGVTLWLLITMAGTWRTLDQIDLDHLDTAEPEREPQLLGLSGFAGAGKDTAAAGLLEDGWTRVSFAAKLKEFAYALDVYDCYGRSVRAMVDAYGWDELKTCDDWYRAFLQRVGTDCGRNILGANVWVDAVMADLPDGDLVFTDVRFPNEAQAIVAAGGHVVRVHREGVGPVNGHPSEHALDGWPFDAILLNNSDAATLGSRARKLAALLRTDDV